MVGKIIISILFIPIKAFVLWIVSLLLVDRQNYKTAFIAAVLIFIISLIEFFPSNTLAINYLIVYGCMIFGLIMLKLLYQCEWSGVIMMWMSLRLLRIPFSIIQNKILNLPWDSIIKFFIRS